MMISKSRIWLIICLCLISVQVWSVPASPMPMQVEMQDGSIVVVYIRGNEHFHWVEREDGVWLTQDEDGRYRSLSQQEVEAIKEKALSGANRQESVTRERLTQSGEEIKNEHQLAKAQEYSPNAEVRLERNLAPRGLVILVEFEDKKFYVENDVAAFHEMLMGDNYRFMNKGYNKNGRLQNYIATGSARKYFEAQSMGQYSPQFDLAGPYTLSHPYSYYGANCGSEDCRFADFVKDACIAADADVDFSIYDNNQDGDIDFVFIIYAGQGESNCTDQNTIWPASGNLPDFGVNAYFDHKRVKRFAYSCELNQARTRDGIGTFCHEFSHVCGLTDLYDTKSTGMFQTPRNWDVMDFGLYCNNSNTPVSYSAYERWFCGWLTPTLLNMPSTCTLAPIDSDNQAYLITPTGEHNMDGVNPNPKTFYLLENRQMQGWDSCGVGHGLLVTKIQFDVNKWIYNQVNTYVRGGQMGVDIIEAVATTAKNYGLQTDVFPTESVNKLTSTTHPNYTIENGPITNIEEIDGEIHFLFMGGEPSWQRTIFEDVAKQGQYSITDIYQVYSPIVIQHLDITDINQLRAGTYVIRYSLNGVAKKKYYKKVEIRE